METKSAIALGVSRLNAAGIISAESEAVQLLGFLTGRGMGEIRADAITGREIPAEILERFEELLARREKREPLQHILGEAPFRELTLHVGPGVFVPRPETESLVEQAAKLIQRPDSLVIDFGAGSGAISISLALMFPHSTVIPVEISADAHPWLQKNLQKYLGESASFVKGDMADALSELAGQVDLIVSNPPYIPDWAVPEDDEVRLYDPELALYGGEDGLREVRILAGRAVELLKSGGRIIIEHAATQGEGVAEVFALAGLIGVHTHLDLVGRPRITQGTKP